MSVSLMAEVLLLAIEPGQGGLLVKPRKLRPALRAATEVEGGRRGGRGALREARRELTDAGLIERGPLRRVRLADRAVAARRFTPFSARRPPATSPTSVTSSCSCCWPGAACWRGGSTATSDGWPADAWGR